MPDIRNKKKWFDWKKWLNYQSIVKQVPFIFYLTFLAVIYIYNGHMSEKIVREVNVLAKEVKELQWEYKSVKSEVMFRSKPSELARALQPLGLNALQQSPYVLKDSIAQYFEEIP